MNNTFGKTLSETYAGPDMGEPTFLERRLVSRLRAVRSGTLVVEFPSGYTETFKGREDGHHAAVSLRSPQLFLRLMASGECGLAEGYMAGEWTSPDLTQLFLWALDNEDALADTMRPSLITRLAARLRHARRGNTRRGSRRNIQAHYDLGNAFFAPWLDGTMTYSSALFEDDAEPHEVAQQRKYRRLAELLALKPDDRVLEIGCGWGGFAEVAARDYGCRVVCLTLSDEQAAYARKRMQDAGLAEKVEIRIQDYRDVEGTFDKIVSIEMFEAVGEENWTTFFEVLDQRLVDGGKAALQSIVIADRHFDTYRRNPDFIQGYIFPGGMLPGKTAFATVAGKGGFRISDTLYFGPSYAESLRRWDADFVANWKDIQPHGFDLRFYRMWRYYLAYCEAGFDKGRIDVGQFLLERG